MPSATYQLIMQAMLARHQVLCIYGGFARALCPAGGASSGLPPGGQWKCLDIAEMSEVELREGRWHAGRSHRQPQHCVAEVELDINPDSPYEPKRSITAPRRRNPGPKR